MKRIIFALLILAVFALPCQAALFTSTQNGDWDDGASWGNDSPGVEGTDYPGNADTSSIGHVIEIDADLPASGSVGAITIANGGTLQYTTAAATTSSLTIAGDINLVSGGTFYIGSTGSKIPNNSRATLTFACTSSYEFGIEKAYGSTMEFQGTANTYHYTRLAANIGAGTITSFTTTDSTGWQVGDRLYLCYSKGDLANSTDEVVAITGISGTTIYVDSNGNGSGTGVALGNHHGHEDPQGLVGNLTQPVIVQASNPSYMADINLEGNASHTDFDCDGVRFYLMSVGNRAEWKHYSFSLDDVSFETCASLPNGRYCTWRADDETFTRIIHYNSGRFLGSSYSTTYYAYKIEIVNSIIGYTSVGGNWSDFTGAVTLLIFKDSFLISRYANGGEYHGITGAYIIYLENFEMSNCGGLTDSRFFSPRTGTKIESRNSNYGRFGGRYGKLFHSWQDELYLGKNDTINSSYTTTWLTTTYEVTPRIRINNFGGISGRHKSQAHYGTISDQVTGGQAAAWAYGGSGICAYIDPTSTTAGQTVNLELQIPVTAATNPTLKFYVKKTSAGADCTLELDVYDSDDDLTLLIDDASVTLTDSWAQYSAASISPTNTGFCRVVLRALNGSTTGDIGIDDVSIVISGTTATDNINSWVDGLPSLQFDRGGGGGGEAGASFFMIQ